MSEEACTLLQEAAQVVSSRPITGGLWAEGEPHSPEHFMHERATTRIPSAKFETGLQLIRWFKMIQEAKEEFWER